MTAAARSGRFAVAGAPAKVNLLLRVLAREEGGYHRIETLFQMLEWGDLVRVEPTASDSLELVVEGPDPSDPEDNLAVRAAEGFMRAVGSPSGVRINLEKRIPPGAGLGGGSSDAAAVLRCLSALAEPVPDRDRILQVAGELGADVPFFLAPSPLCLGWGRGDRLLPLSPLPEAEIVLVLPDFHVSTAEAYRSLGEDLPPERARILPGAEGLGWEEVVGLAENDFERVVLRDHPELGRIRDRLAGEGARPVRLSGSGGALFGVFPPGEGAPAAEAVEPELPEGWRVRVTRSRTAPAPLEVRGPGDG